MKLSCCEMFLWVSGFIYSWTSVVYHIKFCQKIASFLLTFVCTQIWYSPRLKLCFLIFALLTWKQLKSRLFVWGGCSDWKYYLNTKILETSHRMCILNVRVTKNIYSIAMILVPLKYHFFNGNSSLISAPILIF